MKGESSAPVGDGRTHVVVLHHGHLGHRVLAGVGGAARGGCAHASTHTRPELKRIGQLGNNHLHNNLHLSQEAGCILLMAKGRGEEN